jgi:serine/threonine protein kinase
VNIRILCWLGLWGLFHSAETSLRDLKPQNILLNTRGEAFIADLGVAKTYNSFDSANKISDITDIGSPIWMSPEMREAWSKKLNAELPKSDIFSIGLIACFCIDTAEFNDKLSPILSQFKIEMTKEEVGDHLKNLEKQVLAYLEDFRLRNLNSTSLLNFLDMLKPMLSFSPCARPTIQQLYEDFSVLSNNFVNLKLKLVFD